MMITGFEALESRLSLRTLTVLHRLNSICRGGELLATKFSTPTRLTLLLFADDVGDCLDEILSIVKFAVNTGKTDVSDLIEAR